MGKFSDPEVTSEVSNGDFCHYDPSVSIRPHEVTGSYVFLEYRQECPRLSGEDPDICNITGELCVNLGERVSGVISQEGCNELRRRLAQQGK